VSAKRNLPLLSGHKPISVLKHALQASRLRSFHYHKYPVLDMPSARGV
jgi:hypothetical protein